MINCIRQFYEYVITYPCPIVIGGSTTLRQLWGYILLVGIFKNIFELCNVIVGIVEINIRGIRKLASGVEGIEWCRMCHLLLF